jgi:hypothetical protein
MLGVKTVGNATLIAYDEVPILATDPGSGARMRRSLAAGVFLTKFPPPKGPTFKEPNTSGSHTAIPTTSTLSRSSACNICRFCSPTMAAIVSRKIWRPKVTTSRHCRMGAGSSFRGG